VKQTEEETNSSFVHGFMPLVRGVLGNGCLFSFVFHIATLC